MLNFIERSANRSSRRRSKECESVDPSRDILTLDKIRVSCDNIIDGNNNNNDEKHVN